MKFCKSLLVFALVAAAFCGCGKSDGKLTQEACLDFLYQYMPDDDKFAYDRPFWEANVGKTLEVRDRMGWDVPDREFLHFVVPVRVDDESLDRFRLEYADSLCEVVRGLSMRDAVLAINTWCYSYINYVFGEETYYSPLATMYHKGGQCDALSVFTVSALRAAGIPARKVDVFWPNVNLGHSWTEVWVDGKWHFIGSAERHLDLDMAWFADRASQCLQTVVEVFGDYDGPEHVISRTDRTTRINTLAIYTDKLRDAEVRVLGADGKPVEDANVQFMMYSNGTLSTLNTCRTGTDGLACLPCTGLGSIVAFAFKGDRYGLCVTNDAKADIVLDEQLPGPVHFKTVELLTPPPSPIAPQDTAEQFRRLLAENVPIDAIRESRVWPDPDSLARKAILDVRRRHIPFVKLPSTIGGITLEPVVSGDILYGRDFSVMRFGEERLEPMTNSRVTSGCYLLVTGFRPEADRVILGLDTFVIPDNINIVRVPVAPRTDYK